MCVISECMIRDMYQNVKHISVTLLGIKRQKMMRETVLLAPRERHVKNLEDPKERQCESNSRNRKPASCSSIEEQKTWIFTRGTRRRVLYVLSADLSAKCVARVSVSQCKTCRSNTMYRVFSFDIFFYCTHIAQTAPSLWAHKVAFTCSINSALSTKDTLVISRFCRNKAEEGRRVFFLTFLFSSNLRHRTVGAVRTGSQCNPRKDNRLDRQFLFSLSHYEFCNRKL